MYLAPEVIQECELARLVRRFEEEMLQAELGREEVSEAAVEVAFVIE